LSKIIAEIIKSSNHSINIIASSDMNHFADLSQTEYLDNLAIAKVLARDPLGLLKTVEQHQISMCGVIPVLVMLLATQYLGAEKAELVAYTTSAEVTQDPDSVVGYAGIIVT